MDNPISLRPQKKRYVFISYQHINPDMELAIQIVSRLEAAGITVIFDQQIELGERWEKWIDQNVRNADFLMVLISATSMRSDMVRQEIKIAHEQALQNGGFPKILPLRVDYSGDLPYDLGAYLNPLQYLLYTPATSIDTITAKIIAAVVKNDASSFEKPADSGRAEGQADLYNKTIACGAPLPSADYMLETGAMKQNSHFYVRRSCDDALFNFGKGNGVTMVIKGPRQVGKSSLLARFCTSVRDEGGTCFMLDFQSIEDDRFTDLKTLLRFIARRVERSLKLRIAVNDVWDDDEGPKMNMMDYLQQALLDEGEGPVYFLFDEVDRVFSSAFCTDFFSALRGWHNERAHNRSWNRLNLVLAHSTEPHLWIADEFQSPFNVGYSIQMDDFTSLHIAMLNQKYGSPVASEELASFEQLTGGHPYLVRQGLFALSQARTAVPNFAEMAVGLHGPYGDHLKRYLYCLQQNKPLINAFRDSIRHGKCGDEMQFYKLRAAGLVKGESRDQAIPRCGLYQQFFSRHL